MDARWLQERNACKASVDLEADEGSSHFKTPLLKAGSPTSDDGDWPSARRGSSLLSPLPKNPFKAKALAPTTFALSVALYASCSSLMLVANKVAVHFLPAPSILLLFQLISTTAAVWLSGRLGWLEHDRLEWRKVKAFGLVPLAFVAAVFTNMKTLQYANIETFVVFRSSTPLVISILDWGFLGRTMPTLRSWASLFFIFAGAAGYVLTDSTYGVQGYFWVSVWYAVFTFDQVYIKYACNTVKMNNWGRVYYTNLLSCVPVTGLMIAFGETMEFQEWLGTNPSPEAWGALAASCVCGIGMSYSGFFCRTTVSATMFTVVGVICKVVTILVNCLIWDKHASPQGICFLFLWYASPPLLPVIIPSPVHSRGTQTCLARTPRNLSTSMTYLRPKCTDIPDPAS